MAFEVFDKRNTALGRSPSVTVQRKGIFSLNRAAHSLLNEAGTVELLFDKEDGIIGMRPVGDEVAHGYAVRPQSQTRDTGPVLVAGTAFTLYFDIDTSISRRYTPHLIDGVLCLNLKTDGVEIVGNRSGKTIDGRNENE
ncbi:hypothetical protein [Rhodococcus globerulus]|uniref:hypothetical protein n=1 Tax=Rhodococcus globerulus TaxID=33008 RepID=UPI0005262ED4|nr:hypothetical protein [Rhodococcus globerulus]PVX59710.1 hypothetical protein C8E04_6299 [Rhodococcus globerulus]